MTSSSDLPLAKLVFDQLDRLRRLQGDLVAASGCGPVETPSRTVHVEPGLRLRRYEPAGQAREAQGPAMLMVPAPIKRAYIWDLAPRVSAVRRCLEQGMPVYLAEWTRPDASLQDYGMADYGDRLLAACVDAIAQEDRQPAVILAGHSLGGLFAASFACLHPRRIRALVLLESPLHFGKDAGDFAPLVAATPDSGRIRDAFGLVPGSFLDLVSIAAAPEAFQWELWRDRAMSMLRPDALSNHLRVTRWTLDESPLPGRLFVEIVEQLYREDRFTRGILKIAGRHIGPRDLRMPLLNVVDPRSTVIPARSILPFHKAAASAEKKLLFYRGDVGVGIQHVGVLVGASAHAWLWPRIFAWLRACGLLPERRPTTA